MRRLLKQEVEEYVDKIKDKVVQEGNNTQIGGHLEVDGNATVNGTVDGNIITGDEIVEKMEGYSISLRAITNGEFSPIYIGACKNGNKLTLVVFGNLTFTELPSSNNTVLLDFYIPSSVGDKLFPYTIGSITNMLDRKDLKVVSALLTTKDLVLITQKGSANRLQIGAWNTNNLEPNINYTIRYEITFLLNENLVTQ